MASIRHLFRAMRHRLPMEELPEAAFVADFGIEGCAHGRPGSRRQVLLMDKESLDAMELVPGIVRENVTTEGLPVNALPIGQKLRIGSVLLEVAMVCTPC